MPGYFCLMKFRDGSETVCRENTWELDEEPESVAYRISKRCTNINLGSVGNSLHIFGQESG